MTQDQEPLPEQTDNRPRPEDGEQNVPQDPDINLTVASVVDENGADQNGEVAE